MTEIGEDSEVSQGGIDLAPDRGQNLADPGKIAFDMKRNLTKSLLLPLSKPSAILFIADTDALLIWSTSP